MITGQLGQMPERRTEEWEPKRGLMVRECSTMRVSPKSARAGLELSVSAPGPEDQPDTRGVPVGLQAAAICS